MTATPLLLVDDEPLVRESLAEYLSGQGFQLSLAESEEEAVRMAIQDKPGVIISDLMLGKGSGLSLFNRVRREFKDSDGGPCCILMTGFGTLETAVEAMRLGVDDYLLKPVRLNELSSAVTAGLARRRFRQRPAPQDEGDQLAENFYHEISAPLTVLRAYLDMFSEGRFGPLTMVQEEKMEVLRSNMGQVVKILRGFHQQWEKPSESLVLERVEPAELLRSVRQLFFLDFERRGVNVILGLPANLPEVEIDKRQALMILETLFGNCLAQARFAMTLRVNWSRSSGSLSLKFRFEPWQQDSAFEERLFSAFSSDALAAGGMAIRAEPEQGRYEVVFLRPCT